MRASSVAAAALLFFAMTVFATPIEWDHRGGYSGTPEQSYTNVVAAVHSGDKDRLYGLFKKETPKGQPCNPYMLPLGRVVIKVPGKTLKLGTLDPFTGLGSLEFAEGGAVGLAMSKMVGGVFAMAFPKDGSFSGPMVRV